MKRTLIFALCLLMLAGCGSQSAPPAEAQAPQLTEAPAAAAVPEKKPAAAPAVPETEAPTEATLPPPPPFHYTSLDEQSQIYNWDVLCSHNGRVYTSYYDGHYTRYGYTDDQGKTFHEINHQGGNLAVVLEDQLYFATHSSKMAGIYRSDLEGKNAQLLLQLPNRRISHAVQYHDGYFYFTDYRQGDKLVRFPKDGGELQLILDKAVYYPVIHEDWVLYQDDGDTMSLHWARLDGSEDYKLNDTYSFYPYFDGEHIYYLCVEDFGPGTDVPMELWQMDPNGENNHRIGTWLVEHFMVDDTYIYFTNGEDEEHLWRMKKDGTEAALFADPAQFPPNQPIKVLRGMGDYIICHLDVGAYWLGNYVISREDGTLLGRY